jgi:sugar lactone lactonase YvrE
MKNLQGDAELVWDCRCELSESPVIDDRTGRLYFIDIYGRKVLAYGTTDGAKQTWDMPSNVASLGLCQSGRVLVALDKRAVFLDPESGSIEDFSEGLDEPDFNKLNDGKVGPDGCFWVGSRNGSDPRQHTGVLYRLTPDGRFTAKADGYLTCNGLAWSPDGRTMFHSDSSQRIVDAWDFDAANGDISNRRRIVEQTEAEGHPDGAACDTEGNYWSACPRTGCLKQISPTGELLTRIALPIPFPTMPCFAGKHLYITSLRRNRSAEIISQHPTLGGLFRMDAPAEGAEVSRFADV